jgi:hypothetical protein
MKHMTPLAAVVCLAPLMVQAEDNTGLTLMERGALLFMEGVLKEMEPAIGELSDLADKFGPALQQFADEMGPALNTLLEEVEDWSVYEAPEILPNGDIIIRRKPDRAEPEAETAPEIDI